MFHFNSIFRVLNIKSLHCLKPYFPSNFISKLDHLTRIKVELSIDFINKPGSSSMLNDDKIVVWEPDGDKHLYSAIFNWHRWKVLRENIKNKPRRKVSSSKKARLTDRGRHTDRVTMKGVCLSCFVQLKIDEKS